MRTTNYGLREKAFAALEAEREEDARRREALREGAEEEGRRALRKSLQDCLQVTLEEGAEIVASFDEEEQTVCAAAPVDDLVFYVRFNYHPHINDLSPLLYALPGENFPPKARHFFNNVNPLGIPTNSLARLTEVYAAMEEICEKVKEEGNA